MSSTKTEILNPLDTLPSNQNTMSTLVLYFNYLVEKLLGSTEEAKTQDVNVTSNELKEYESKSVQKTLDNSFVPTPILNARKIQDEIITRRFKGKPLRIADIGCGDGYHGETFAPDCLHYHGFEISSEMAKKTRNLWKNLGLDNTKVTEDDAATVELEADSLDVVWSLYFTSGNFREEFDDIRKYDDVYLDANPQFIKIISNFYNALRLGGKMFLTVYKDAPVTEKMQRTFYKQTGQTVITPLGSRFVATKENFWSVRWTKRSMLANLAHCGITPEQVKFNDLNEVAWLVEVTK